MQYSLRKMICSVATGCFAACAFSARPAAAGTLSTNVIGMFPKNVGEFAYADMKAARRIPWFRPLEDQMLPSRFRQFEQFLSAAGIDPNTQADELAWGAVPAQANQPEQIVGVALGEFSPDAAEARLDREKLPSVEIRGYKLYAFGTGVGSGDILFFFLDSNTAVFGQRQVLEKLIEVHYGEAESLLANNTLFPLINEVNGNGMIWAVLNQGYTQMAMQQLLPQAGQFPQAGTIIKRIHAMEININASDTVDARLQAVCDSPDDANMLAALLQGGVMYRRYQAQQNNPDLAQALSNVTISPSGERLKVDIPLSNDQMITLIRTRTFLAPM